ncbi:arsenic resistance protein [Salibacterium qingdaonense]|uniref:Arsenite efflux pump ArsB, ACR3 family n=1 Tax=Salibacterium qingdaonense TaxID=266892 RepID=A0A1I4LJ24_9BACI|nr:bile acid:sodium symporter [Salibacterium qingdaonense]SFL91015.1 Arsenite efflux pump ArsB, ACR3 family [Salibacterium qingdaonense]
MVTKEQLETKQVGIYIISFIMAAGFGFLLPSYAERLGAVISVVIALLMYSMFSQIPFAALRQAFRNRTYIQALLLVNFILVPVVVWLLSQLLPDQPALLLGFYLVLLTPCIDYVIAFTSLGKGDENLVLTSTPILFVVQMVLLPVYLWLFMGADAAAMVKPAPFFEAFFGLIVLPLAAALLLQFFGKNRAFGEKVLRGSAWLPVPFMALTLFVVTASQMTKLPDYADQVVKVIPLYIVFMMVMPFVAKYAARWFGLAPGEGRALIFSCSTRNSLVVLPIALTIPEIGTIVAAVVITQTMIELVSELVYIRVVPRFLIRDD